MKRERILITGGAGYLGSVLTDYFISKGHHVTCLDNLLYHQKTPMLFSHHSNYDFVYGDVRDRKILNELIPLNDAILPLAAIVGMPACNQRQDEAKSINRDSIIVLNNLLSSEQKLIYPTTNSGYGAKSGEIFCTEETPLEPISLYGQTKTEAELELLNSGKSVISLRLATVFGLSPRMRIDLLVNDFVYRALTDNYLVLYEPNFKRNYIHIRDIARCFEHCLLNFEDMRKAQTPVFNVGLDNANLSKLELAERIKMHIPSLEIIESEIGEDPDKRNYIVSNEKISKTGFKPIFTLDNGIQELIKGYSILIKNHQLKNI